MVQALTRSSRFLILGGIAAVIFGIAALVWPGITLVALIALFGAYAFVAGVFGLIAGIELASQGARHWVPMVLSGVGGIVIGALTFFVPGLTALALVYLIAAWAIVAGVFEIVAGIQLTGVVNRAWVVWATGLLSLAFGVLVAVNPGSGALTIVWLIGIYAIVAGALRLTYAYTLRHARDEMRSAVRRFEAPSPEAVR
ncbi:MAG TPA: HdeD family acid-resistance protein [Candidatus Dormibacteraeota bacterium]|nr:HdeD family acid-resistance protein [Candidatus Dormibacteraeota bacterium]